VTVPYNAVLFNVNVAVASDPPFTGDVTVKERGTGEGTTVKDTVFVTAPNLAVIVPVVFTDTGELLIVNDTEVAPAGTVTSVGVIIAA